MWLFGKKMKTQEMKRTEPVQELLENGDLPWGWTTRNKEFVGKVQAEYEYFLELWLASRKKSSKEEYSALKSFVLYMEDVKMLCKGKGECFEFWFTEILTGNGYLEKRKGELQTLERKMMSDK